MSNKRSKSFRPTLLEMATTAQTLLGWVLAVLLLAVGIAQVLGGVMSSGLTGLTMIALAIIVCPKTPLAESWRLFAVAVVGGLILFLG